MSQPPSTIPVRADIEMAADLRAAGCAWDNIAGRLGSGLTGDVVETWPVRYRDVWGPQFVATNRRLAAEGEAEARAILRHDLRRTTDKERRDIARKLIDLGRRTTAGGLPTSSPSDVQHLTDYLEGLSHDDLRTHLEDLLAELEGDRDDDRGGPPVG